MQAMGAVEWIQHLISLDSTSRKSNLPLLEFVANRIDHPRVVTDVFPNAEGDKANLLVTIPAADGSVEGGLVLSGHTDAVPVDGQTWTTDPYTATVVGDRLYGRGASDMKSFIGVGLSLVPLMLEARLREPVHFALTYDEEVGLYGGAHIVEDLRASNLTPRFCIVGEPSGMRVITAHKSITIVDAVVHGTPGHSSLAPLRVNAATFAGKLIAFLDELAQEHIRVGPFDAGYEVPHTTVSVDQVIAGNRSTTVPGECLVRFDFRTIAAVAPESILERVHARAQEIAAEMKALDQRSGIEFSSIALAPGLETERSCELAELLRSLGAVDDARKVVFGSEAGFFQQGGIETVVCGPGFIQQAHIANEFIELEQIRECERLLTDLVRNMSD